MRQRLDCQFMCLAALRSAGEGQGRHGMEEPHASLAEAEETGHPRWRSYRLKIEIYLPRPPPQAPSAGLQPTSVTSAEASLCGSEL